MQCCFSKNDISYLLRVLIRDSMQFVYLNRQIFLSSPVGVTSQRYMYSYWKLSEEDFTQARLAFVNRCLESRDWEEKNKVNIARISEKIDSIVLYRHQNSPSI